MAKLYPPSIEGKLPAFAGESLKIPITMNRTVNINQVGSMRAMIKTVQTSQLKATLIGSLNYEQTTGRYYAIFNLTGNFQPNLGQFYKIQIAYVDKTGEIGYYSSVGIAKYTSYPIIEIPGLQTNFYCRYDYIGTYSQEDQKQYSIDEETGEQIEIGVIKRDNTEKVYSYCFELTDRDGNIVATTGVKLHDATTDQSTSFSQDSWSLRRDLEKDIPYYIQYKVVTMNGLEVSSAKYLIMDQDSVDIDRKLTLISNMDYDNGSIVLHFYPSSDTNEKFILMNGSFILSRSSSEDNFTTWNEVYRFTYSNITLTADDPIKLWEDYTVKQGIEYTYAIQGYNSYGLYSNRILSINKNNPNNNIIQADFEDAFLYDGERQLKIRYNPKVPSFKETVLESKVDTVGGKFPFIFRNGNVGYKEFPISGLISLQSDPEERFLNGIQSADLVNTRERTPSTQIPSGSLDNHLTSLNIQRERDFKMAVLGWLNNGKPKMFRSPTEGNYIVRLMNVNMTPNDTVGRMLHNFSCNAYEISECTFDNLINLGLMSIPLSRSTNVRVGQISLKSVAEADEKTLTEKYPDFTVQNNTKAINLPSVTMANITDATPGTVFGLSFANSQGEVVIEIGETGSYYVLLEDQPLISINLMQGKWDNARLTFNYLDDTPADTFSHIANLTLSDEIRQIIGPGFDVNIVDGLADIRREIGAFHYIKVIKRQIENVWKKDENYYRTDIGLDRVDKFDRTLIYYVVNQNKYIDGNTGKTIDKLDYRFALNPQDINDYILMEGRNNPYTCNVCGWQGESSTCPNCEVEIYPHFGDTFGRIEAIRNVEKVDRMWIGNGVMVDVAYRVKTKSFVLEETDQQVLDKKKIWLNAIENLNKAIAHPAMTNAYYDEKVAEVDSAYKDFVEELTQALKDGGIMA